MTLDFADRILDSCESTNDLVRQLGEQGFPHGTWVSTREQTRGRGPIGPQMKSHPGKHFNYLQHSPPRPDHLTMIPLASAVGIVRALSEEFPSVDLRIKWPNDLWVDQRKLGGILCEGVGTPSGAFIVVGIGLNCATHPDGLEFSGRPATSLARAAGVAPEGLVDRVRPQVHRGVLDAIEELDTQGPSSIADQYAAHAALAAGTPIAWNDASGEHAGVVSGLGSAGEMIVRKATGDVRLFAEEVRIGRPISRTRP
jgi:BirA family biotin operon repressor/biotin-[acetyl-CoA-carboxylase] ligase